MGPIDYFVDRSGTDLPPQAYADGQLGVLLPGYERVHLYAAWRAITLGQAELKKHPGAPDGMRRALGTTYNEWSADPQQPANRWIAASNAVLQRPAGGNEYQRTIKMTANYSSYVNCPPAAFTFAVDTLKQLGKRADATPQRLGSWTLAQKQVFEFCSYSPDRPQWAGVSKSEAPRMPEDLAASEPLYWRQMREYQIAAAYFYAGDLEKSAQRFAAIGANPAHPMQAWGDYLALRSHARMATLRPQPPGRRADGLGITDQPELYEPLHEEAERILGNPQLGAVHDATHSLLRSLQYRLMPRQRLADLSAQLDDLSLDPNFEDHLGDWRRLANDVFDVYQPNAQVQALEASMRSQHAYFDWIRTIQPCAPGDTRPGCLVKARAAHALKTWAASPAPKNAQEPDLRRTWLVASLMLGDKLPPALEAAALAVPRSAPEYMTVRYHLSRLYRLAGDIKKARAMADTGLEAAAALPAQSNSARNLLRQERMASASSLADAAPYLDRDTLGFRDPDTGERNTERSDRRPDDDGRALLNAGLPLKDLLTLARDEHLTPQTRSRVAIAAWLRADLLDRRADAEAAAAVVAKAAPALKAVTDRYLALNTSVERRHWLLVSALNYHLSATVSEAYIRGVMPNVPLTAPVKDDAVADMWCSVIDRDPRFSSTAAVEPIQVATDVPARDREIAELQRIRTATGVVSDDVMAWARSHPDDPEVPWLLHVVVKSTRGGCLDADASRVSKAAFQLLHKRYKNSEWARKTTVWY